MSGLRSLGRAAPSAGLMACLVSLGGCTNQNATLGVSVIPAPQQAVSFSTHVRPILAGSASCTAAGCHGGSAVSANMNLEKIFDPVVGAVDVPSCEAPPLPRIAPFNSDGSYLIRKLEGSQATATCSSCVGWTIAPSCGSMMPLGSNGLSASDIKILRDWIDQGAQDN